MKTYLLAVVPSGSRGGALQGPGSGALLPKLVLPGGGAAEAAEGVVAAGWVVSE